MESTSPPPPSPAEAADDLAAAHAARDAVAGRLSLPPGYSVVTGLSNCVLAYGIAVANSDWRYAPLAMLGAVVLAAVGLGTAVRAFRRHNGAWISGLSGPPATRLVVALFALVLVLCFVGASLLMSDGRPLLSAVVAAGALPTTVLCDRWWMARYRAGR